MSGKFYSKEFKEEVIDKLKNSGKSVSQIAEQYGIPTKNIYNWLRANTFKDSNVLELNRVKRENQELLEIIGKLTLNISRGKKGRSDR